MIHRLGEARGVSLDSLATGISAAFRIEAVTGRALPLPLKGFDEHRHQHHSAAFLDLLAGLDAGLPGKPVMLGITEADLFVPRLNFVFGQADAERGAAVVSVARLRPEYYGREPDIDRFRERLLKESVHELGHVFGLHHCDNPYCIMRFSHDIADTDRKGPGFCQKCQVALAVRGIGRGV